jgi:hypothetical protein
VHPHTSNPKHLQSIIKSARKIKEREDEKQRLKPKRGKICRKENRRLIKEAQPVTNVDPKSVPTLLQSRAASIPSSSAHCAVHCPARRRHQPKMHSAAFKSALPASTHSARAPSPIKLLSITPSLTTRRRRR